jgi:hypothetical protein
MRGNMCYIVLQYTIKGEKSMKKMIFIACMMSSIAFACPGGQHDECAIPNVFTGGCSQWICVPDVNVNLPPVTLPNLPPINIDVNGALEKQADDIATEGQSRLAFTNHEGCMIFTIAGLGAWGASLGAGPISSAIAGGLGVGAAILACNKWFPPKK